MSFIAIILLICNIVKLIFFYSLYYIFVLLSHLDWVFKKSTYRKIYFFFCWVSFDKNIVIYLPPRLWYRPISPSPFLSALMLALCSQTLFPSQPCGNHCSAFSFVGFAFSRITCKCNHTICNLLVLTSFL